MWLCCFSVLGAEGGRHGGCSCGPRRGQPRNLRVTLATCPLPALSLDARGYLSFMAAVQSTHFLWCCSPTSDKARTFLLPVFQKLPYEQGMLQVMTQRLSNSSRGLSTQRKKSHHFHSERHQLDFYCPGQLAPEKDNPFFKTS